MIGILAAALLLWPQPAQAKPPSLQDEVAGIPGAAPGAKKICRTEAKLGSILPKRLCLTREQWDAITRANESDSDWFRNQHANSATQCQIERSC